MNKHLFYYQRQALEAASKHERFLLALDMGLGKTFTAVNWLKEQVKNENNTLIIADKNKLKDWYAEVIDNGLNAVIIKNSNDLKNLALFKVKNKTVFIVSYGVCRILLLNYELQSYFNLIVDESQALKNPRSVISKLMLAHNDWFLKVLLLSGDPISNGYQNLFVQMRILNIFPRKYSYTQFKNNYCKTFTLPNSNVEIITGYKNTQELLNLLKERAFFLKTQDAIELPSVRDFTYNLTNHKSYSQFKTDRVIKVNDSQLIADDLMTYAHTLRTLASGMLKTDDDKYYLLNSEKLTQLQTLLNDSNFNFSLFYSFNIELFYIKELLDKLKIKYFEFNGHKQQLEQALNCAERFVLLINYKSGSRGIEGLQTKIFNQIYFSPTWSGEEFKQSKKRVHRINQQHKVTYYYLTTTNSIEQNVYKALSKSQDYTNTMFNNDFNLNQIKETDHENHLHNFTI